MLFVKHQVPLLVLLLTWFPTACTAHAQAAPTAEQALRIKVYGMVSYVRPDFDGAKKNIGGTIGGDLDGLHLLPHTDVGLDVRYVGSGGRVSNQYVFSGGPRVTYNLFRVRPYADFLLGHGIVRFNQAPSSLYTQDDSAVYSLGGGVDWMLSRSWGLRADIQRQRWKISQDLPSFHPLQVSIGATYQFHFRNTHGPE